MARDHRARLTPREGRRFGFTVGTAFAVLAAILLWRDRPTLFLIAGSVASLLILAGLAIPSRLGPVQRAWMGLAHAISKVTTPIAMSLVYFIALTPTGLIRQAIGKNSLRRGQSKESVWVRREGSPPSDLERQF